MTDIKNAIVTSPERAAQWLRALLQIAAGFTELRATTLGFETYNYPLDSDSARRIAREALSEITFEPAPPVAADSATGVASSSRGNTSTERTTSRGPETDVDVSRAPSVSGMEWVILRKGQCTFTANHAPDDHFAAEECSRCEEALGFNVPIVLDEGRLTAHLRCVLAEEGLTGDAPSEINADRRFATEARALIAEHAADVRHDIAAARALRPLFTTLLQIEREVYGAAGETPTRGAAQARGPLSTFRYLADIRCDDCGFWREQYADEPEIIAAAIEGWLEGHGDCKLAPTFHINVIPTDEQIRAAAQTDQPDANADAPAGPATQQPPTDDDRRCAWQECNLPRYSVIHSCLPDCCLDSPDHPPNSGCHSFVPPPNHATPPPQVSSPTGTPERVDGSGVPPAWEEWGTLRSSMTAHFFVAQTDNGARMAICGSGTRNDLLAFAPEAHSVCGLCAQSLATVRAVGSLRIATLEAQITELQTANAREVERRRIAETDDNDTSARFDAHLRNLENLIKAARS